MVAAQPCLAEPGIDAPGALHHSSCRGGIERRQVILDNAIAKTSAYP